MKTNFSIVLVTLCALQQAVGDVVMMGPAQKGQIEQQENELANADVEKGFYTQGICVSPLFSDSSKNEINNIPTPVYQDLSCNGETILKHNHLNGYNELSANDMATLIKNGIAIEVITPSGDKTIVYPDGTAHRWNKNDNKWEPYAGTGRDGSTASIENLLKVLKGEEGGNGHGPGSFNEVLAALAKCSQTAEEMTDEIRTACVIDELEDQIKELQQQASDNKVQETPKKENDKKKEKDKDEKKDKEKDKKKENKKTAEQPKKKEAPEKPTPTPNTTETIDFSKLESLLSQQLSWIRSVVSSGKKATSAQVSQFNSKNNQCRSEISRLDAQIQKVSDSKKRSEYSSKLSSILKQYKAKRDPLESEGFSRGLLCPPN